MVQGSSTAPKQAGFRQVMSVVHTWSTLVPIWVLYFVFITGSVGYFHIEVTSWMEPEIEHVSEPIDEVRMLEHAQDYLSENAGDATQWVINFPSERKDTARLSWSRELSPEETEGLSRDERRALQAENRGAVTLNPVTGAIYGDEVRATGGGSLLYRMHYVLHYMPRALGEYIVIISTFLMFAGLITGIIIHKKIFADFFTFRPGKGQRSWLDTHNIFSVMTLPFQIMITFSGLLFYVATVMPLVLYGPAVTLGFDVENIMTAESSDDFSDKNKELIAIIQEDVFGDTPIEPASGVEAEMLPLTQVHADYRSRLPDHAIFNLIVQNVNDETSTATVRAHWGINRQDRPIDRYSAVTGDLLADSSERQSKSAASDVQGVFLGLHEGRFSPIVLRWLYFLTGLAGAVMIASGAILWTSKRRQAHEAEARRFAKRGLDPEAAGAPRLGKGVTFVEHMNVATIIGLPIGIAAYFIANRVIAVGIEDRGALEADALFVVWALTLVYAIIRPRTHIWTELLWLACASYAAIPLVNAFTTDRHLGSSLIEGDWIMAGFDLTMFAIAAAFALAARRAAAKDRAVQKEAKAYPQTSTLAPAE
ncbi:MAG: PepSY-associated TM helix domain-containing protein [Pseudomonadota bacterium]